MTKSPTVIVLRSALWLKICAGLASLFFLAGFTMMCLLQGFSLTTLFFAGFVILSCASLLEAFSRRIILGQDTLQVANLWSNKDYARSEIRSVTWARSCPVSLQLSDGRWVKLPEVESSSQGVVNTIRAWLKR
jgi:hypothetical protein